MGVLFCRAEAIALGAGSSLVPAAVAIPQNTPANASSNDDGSKLAGTWRGDSLCVEKGTGGKVVDGKEIVMGSGEWRYDSAKRTLTVELPRGVITLKLDGDKLEGTFKLPDKTVLRRITLKKSD